MGSSTGNNSWLKFEVFEHVDDTIDIKNLPQTSGTPTSYDTLALSCSTTAVTLASFARIRRLISNCQVYKNIEEYVTNSKGSTNVGVKTIYKIERHGEREPFDEAYRIILWHGTAPSAVAGIIQTGFRQGSGGLFGGGIYFADRIAKSAGYVRQKTPSGTYFFVLAEVAPGRVYKAHHTHSDYKTAPARFDSVKGMGSQIPTWKQNKHYYGAILPVGVTMQNPRHTQYDIGFNEYIMYDPERIIVRFVVECTM